jgi:hypothetical protein
VGFRTELENLISMTDKPVIATLRPGSIPFEADSADGNGLGRACRQGACILFLPANSAHQFVGIRVGIGSNQR